jgi:hypothetical protein
MTGRPVPLPLKQRLYLARSKSDGVAIALVEARDDEQAATRVAYVIGELEMSDWQEVEIQPARGYESRVPTFLDGFFQSGRMHGATH